MTKEKLELKQDEYLTGNHISANRKKGLTKYDQDLIEKCTFTESRCRPMAGKRKLDMESVYTSVKRPKKVHIIARSKQNSISSKMRNGKTRRNISLKKITFHPETDKNFNIPPKVILRSMKQKPKILNLDKPKEEPPVQFKQPPVKIKVRRKSKSKLKLESMNCPSQTAPNNNNDASECDNGTSCDNIVNLKINYICKDFLDDLNPRNVDETPPKTLPHADTCVQKAPKITTKVPKNQTLNDDYSLPYESSSPNGKDVYEFDENEDETIQPLTRKSAASKNDSVVSDTSKSEQKSEPEEKRDYSGKLKLTLKMKKSSFLDDVLEKGNNMKSIKEPQYEVLRLQVDGPVD